MSSLIFQPLLHDPLGWKQGNTTYAEHFQWQKVRVNRKDKFVSPYGQKFLRQQKNKEKVKRANSAVQRSTNAEEIFFTKTIETSNKIEERQSSPLEQIRPPSSKSAPAAFQETLQTRSRLSAASNRESANVSRASHRSAARSVANEEAERSSPVPERYRSLPEEPIVIFVPQPVEDNRHWLNFPNPRTPQNIIDTKVRLGQIKQPALVARSKSALQVSTETTSLAPKTTERVELSKSARSQKPKSNEDRHFLDFNLPATPDDLRAARYRIDKHRYHPSLDNFPVRASTNLVSVSEENSTVSQPLIVEQTETEVLTTERTNLSNQEPSTNQESSTNQENQNENQENQIETVVVPINNEHLPKSYVKALETANAVEQRYVKDLKEKSEKPSEVIVYRLPSRTQEKRSSSTPKLIRQVTPTVSNTNGALRQQDFNTWVRQATDQERTTAIKILNDVLQTPTINDDQLSGQRSTSANRSRSGARKLGRVRTQPRITVDQSDVWNIPKPVFDRNDTLTSFQQFPTSKSAFVQI